MLANERASMICHILEFIFDREKRRKRRINEARMKAKEENKTIACNE